MKLSMDGKVKDWGWLLVALLLIFSGVKVLITGHVQHFLQPAFQASGSAAKASGVVCLILGGVALISWIKKNLIKKS
jgi:hypothetical protein